MNWIEAAGYLASALVLATFCMKTMIPLRCAAICSNVAFIVYGFYDNVYPVLILHGILLPLNIWRAIQMLRLIRRVETASKGDLSTEWLRPFMKEAQWNAGEVIFNRGDHADRLYMIIPAISISSRSIIPYARVTCSERSACSPRTTNEPKLPAH
jgi:CRP/FNR family cyclic AMP-dependent transcriptional regulator